jgi:putative ABC transport system permease protein
MQRLFESIKIAFQSLVSNKLRAFLTMLGIIIGVGAVVAMMSIGTGAQESVIKSVQDIGSNIIIVVPGNRQEQQQGFERMLGDDRDKEALKVEDVKMIEKEAKLIKGAAPVVLSSSIITYLNKNTRASVYASSENAEYIYNFEMEQGQFYTASDVQNSANVVVIGRTIINKIFIIRDHKVMMDRDLAELYGVDTRMLNQAVKRNIKRFPEDFNSARKRRNSGSVQYRKLRS